MAAWIVAVLLLPSVFSFSVDDSIHYAVKFDVPDPGKTAAVDENEQVTVVTRNSEQYTCVLPKVTQESESRNHKYDGPTPWELISKLKEHNLCSKRGDPYWAYEVCHGRYVMQYHEDKMGRTQYYLGNFHPNYISKWDSTKRDTIKYNGEDLVYLPVLYTQGTACDLTGQPRTTKVLYVCVPNAGQFIESVTEISTCTYEVVVLTDLLCSHPVFASKKSEEHPIVCTINGQDGKSREKGAPLGFVPLEKWQKNHFHAQYAASPSAPQSEVLRMEEEEDDDSTNLDSLYQEMERKKALQEKGSMVVEQGQDMHSALAFSTERIMQGEECIDGGVGWWKYELCIGRHVMQYHVEGKERTTVLLGTWNEQLHKLWVDTNPAKKPVKFAGEITQISQLYSKGEICEETGVHRSIEVRIKCDKSEKGTPLAVTISMHEPSLCQYVLVMEGQRFCHYLQKADQYGLFRHKGEI